MTSVVDELLKRGFELPLEFLKLPAKRARGTHYFLDEKRYIFTLSWLLGVLENLLAPRRDCVLASQAEPPHSTTVHSQTRKEGVCCIF